MSPQVLTTIRRVAAIALSFVFATAAFAQGKANPADEATIKEVTGMLTQFLAPANNKTVAAHERFWADDLVYTSSTGIVRSKAEILKLVGDDAKSAPATSTEPEKSYATEQVLVRPYGNAAALTARLGLQEKDQAPSYYRVSGMLLKRHGKWQVVTWQATKEEPEAK